MKKKSLLFGAVAMLMVSIIALTATTYAWFASTDSPKVSEIEAKVSSSTTLLINSQFDGDYYDTLTEIDNYYPTLDDGLNGIYYNKPTSQVPITPIATDVVDGAGETYGRILSVDKDGNFKYSKGMEINSTLAQDIAGGGTEGTDWIYSLDGYINNVYSATTSYTETYQRSGVDKTITITNPSDLWTDYAEVQEIVANGGTLAPLLDSLDPAFIMTEDEYYYFGSKNLAYKPEVPDYILKAEITNGTDWLDETGTVSATQVFVPYTDITKAYATGGYTIAVVKDMYGIPEFFLTSGGQVYLNNTTNGIGQLTNTKLAPIDKVKNQEAKFQNNLYTDFYIGDFARAGNTNVYTYQGAGYVDPSTSTPGSGTEGTDWYYDISLFAAYDIVNGKIVGEAGYTVGDSVQQIWDDHAGAVVTHTLIDDAADAYGVTVATITQNQWKEYAYYYAPNAYLTVKGVVNTDFLQTDTTSENLSQDYMYIPVYFKSPSDVQDVYLTFPKANETAETHSRFVSSYGTNTTAQKQLERSLRLGFFVTDAAGNNYDTTTVSTGQEMTIYAPFDTIGADIQGDYTGKNQGGIIIPNLYRVDYSYGGNLLTTTNARRTALTALTAKGVKGLHLGTINPTTYDSVTGDVEKSSIMLVHFFVWIEGNDVDNTSSVAGGTFKTVLTFLGIN